MKRFKLLAAQCLLVISMLAPWASVEARETFEASVRITERHSLRFESDERVFRISSQMQMFSNDSQKRSYSDLRRGDVVYVRGEVVNGQRYVREIHYETPEEF